MTCQTIMLSNPQTLVPIVWATVLLILLWPETLA
jgi:hypothetical protein